MKTTFFQNDPNLRLTALLLLFALPSSVWAKTQSFALHAKAPDPKAPVFPLRVSANRRYLVDQNNHPFLIVGDSPQAMPTMISVAEARKYFDNRQAHGFNAVWINVLCASPYFPACRADGSTYDGIRPFTGYLSGKADTAHDDLTKPNPAYFARVTQMLRLAAAHRMLVFLDPIETGQWLQTLVSNGPAAARAYGEYLGDRYRNFTNIIWLNGNDFGSWQNPAHDAVVLAVAEGIKSADPRSLQTVELNPPWGSPFDDPAWVPLSSLNGAYTYGATYIQVLRNYNQEPTAPVYLQEAHYDLENVGDPPDFGTPSVLRREEYWTMLSGGKGQLYGNSFTWSFKPGWPSHLDTVGVAQLMIWRRFFSSLPWWELVPDATHTVVTAGLGTYGNAHTRVSQSDFCTAARTSDGAWVVAYLPTLRPITVNMASLKAPARARWFDPTDGAYTVVPGGPFANSGSRQFTPPGKNHAGDGDWVLVLRASASADHDRN